MAEKKNISGRIGILPDIAGFYGFITFALLFLFNNGKALGDGDTFWHIAAGQHMLKTRAILMQDVFSHTAFGKPWTAHEWLSEIIMAWVHQHGGLIGTVLFFFLIAALSFWLLFRIVSAATNDWIAILAVSVALTFSMTHMLARPHVFSWLFGVIVLYALQKQGRWLWILPPLTALWANLHGGFILGLALQGLFLGGILLDDFFTEQPFSFKTTFKTIRRPATFMLLSVLAAGINPFGFSLYLFPFHVASDVFARGIVEWLPPNFQEQWLYRIYLLIVLLFMSLKSAPTNWTDRLFVLFFINASLTHQRYMGIASVFICPYFARMLQSSIRVASPFRPATKEGAQLPTSPLSGPLAIIITAVILCMLAGSSYTGARQVLGTFMPLPESSHPTKAVAHLNQTTRPEGNMFNHYAWGGYLIYALDPAQKVFIDGRADMYGEEIFEDYRKIISLDKDAEKLLKNYGIDWVLFPLDSALVRYLKATGKWQEIYSDGEASILRRLTLNSP